MTTHLLKLAQEPFDSIKEGKKTIESRLNDEKRRAIKIGDQITFINRDNPAQELHVVVTNLMHYKSFKEMFEDNDPHKFGGESVAWLRNQIDEFYSLQDQNENGVVGIEFTSKNPLE